MITTTIDNCVTNTSGGVSMCGTGHRADRMDRMTRLTLTREQRNLLLREGRAHMRRYPHDDCVSVSDRIFTVMLDNEVEYGLGEFEATEISDYAYGVATFITARRGW